jgi:UDP-3-O-[3-hydroxymyristoyl] glucosamine N-acyltransferase
LFNQNQDILHEITIQEINDILKGIMGTSQSITAPEQLEAASESEISFIGNKNMKNFGRLKACVAVVNEDIGIKPGEGSCIY